MEIANTAALVTGAGAGIGRATALLLAAAGAGVVLADIDADGVRETAQLIGAGRGRAVCVRADVARPAGIQAMVAAAERTYGGLDLVNNAGVVEAVTTQRVTFPDVEPERWMRMLEVNVTGVILGTHYAIAAMRARGAGVVINIASAAGVGSGPHDAPVYAASKAAVVRFTTALAGLRERANVRVNCICPGWVDTPMSQRFRAETAPDVWAAMAPAVMLQPEQIADAVVAVIRDEALAGRVLLYPTPGAPWQVLPVTSEG